VRRPVLAEGERKGGLTIRSGVGEGREEHQPILVTRNGVAGGEN